jgi:hypothetical protein
MKGVAVALGLALGLVACCTSSPRPGSPPRDREPDPVSVENLPDAKEPPVPAPAPASASFTFVSRKRERPPLSTLTFDVSLRNPGDRARWFLFPASTAKGQRPIATSTYAVTVWAFVGTGNVVVADFSGAASFYALQLPPAAEVELRSVKVRLTGELPANPLPLEIIVADDFAVGGQAPLAWTQTPATCEARADATQTDARRLLEKTTPDLGAVPVEVHGAERLAITVDVPP